MGSTWRVLVVAAAAMAFGSEAARAQYTAREAGGARLLVGGGSSIALSDFGDEFNNGPHGILAVSYQPRGWPIGFRVDGMYHRISGDEDVLGFDDLDTQVINGTLNAVYSFTTSAETPIRPYILAGGGIYSIKPVGDDVPGDPDAETDPGINAGAGFDYRATDNLGIFLEGRFHLIFTEDEDVPGSSDTNVLPISLGVRIGRS